VPGAAEGAVPLIERPGAAAGLLPGAKSCAPDAEPPAIGSGRARAGLAAADPIGPEAGAAELARAAGDGADTAALAGGGPLATAAPALAGRLPAAGEPLSSLIRSTVAGSRLAKLLALTSRPQP
jgi:hypothetical protein